MSEGHYQHYRIILHISEALGVSLADMRASTRKAEIVRARQAAMWALRHHTTLSYPEIGRLFDRDHTTVIHAVARIDGARRANASLARLLDGVA